MAAPPSGSAPAMTAISEITLRSRTALHLARVEFLQETLDAHHGAAHKTTGCPSARHCTAVYSAPAQPLRSGRWGPANGTREIVEMGGGGGRPRICFSSTRPWPLALEPADRQPQDAWSRQIGVPAGARMRTE